MCPEYLSLAKKLSLPSTPLPQIKMAHYVPKKEDEKVKIFSWKCFIYFFPLT